MDGEEVHDPCEFERGAGHDRSGRQRDLGNDEVRRGQADFARGDQGVVGFVVAFEVVEVGVSGDDQAPGSGEVAGQDERGLVGAGGTRSEIASDFHGAKVEVRNTGAAQGEPIEARAGQGDVGGVGDGPGEGEWVAGAAGGGQTDGGDLEVGGGRQDGVAAVLEEEGGGAGVGEVREVGDGPVEDDRHVAEGADLFGGPGAGVPG